MTRGWAAAHSSHHATTVATARTALTGQTTQPRRTASLAGWSVSALAHAAAFALLAGHFGAKQTTEPPVVPPIAIDVVTPTQRAAAVATPVAPPRPSTPTPAMQQHPHNPAPPASPPPSARHAAPAAVTKQPAAPATSHSQEAASAQPAAAASAAPSAAASAAPAGATHELAEPPELPVTPPVGNAAYLHNPPPRYPQSAQEEGWEGRVVLRVHVDAGGHPVEVRLHASSNHDVLDNAALAAVRQWSFVPAKRGSTPTDGWVDVPLDFRLN